MFLFGRSAAHHRRFTAYITALLALGALTACATASNDPLQSIIATATPIPTAVQSPVPAGTGIVAVTLTANPNPAGVSTAQASPGVSSATPIPASAAATATRPERPNAILGTATTTSTPLPTPTMGTPGTPDTRLTSTSVVATITALAATPTYPPTDAPRPTRRAQAPIGAAGDHVPPTTAPSKTGITVQALSERVAAGGTATLTIKTQPKAVCELSNIRTDGAGREVLDPIRAGATRTAGSDGVIAWIWTVASDEPAGSLRLVVNCGSAGVNQVQMQVN